jgi:hypothetical protein
VQTVDLEFISPVYTDHSGNILTYPPLKTYTFGSGITNVSIGIQDSIGVVSCDFAVTIGTY